MIRLKWERKVPAGNLFTSGNPVQERKSLIVALCMPGFCLLRVRYGPIDPRKGKEKFTLKFFTLVKRFHSKKVSLNGLCPRPEKGYDNRD